MWVSVCWGGMSVCVHACHIYVSVMACRDRKKVLIPWKWNYLIWVLKTKSGFSVSAFYPCVISPTISYERLYVYMLIK